MFTMANPVTVLNAPVVANAPSPVVTWSENPLAKDLNSGMTQGQKIFLELTQGPPDGKWFNDSHLESAEFIQFLCTKSHAFGTIISNVPTAFNNAGQPTQFKNIIQQYQTIDLIAIKCQAHSYWSTVLDQNDAIANASVNSWIAPSLDPGANDDDKKVSYSWV